MSSPGCLDVGTRTCAARGHVISMLTFADSGASVAEWIVELYARTTVGECRLLDAQKVWCAGW